MADPPQSVDLETFRTRLRLDILERIVLLISMREPVLSGRQKAFEVREELEQLFDEDVARIDKATGERFGDPALTALYADEALAVVQSLRAQIAKYEALLTEWELSQ